MSANLSSHAPLRWGLLSTARINQAIIPVLRDSKRNQLLAVASRAERRAASYAKEWGIPRAFGSYEELLEDAEIDVVYNSLPNHLHCEWTVKAAQAGKHVLCEKPLALTVQEVDAMAAAAESAGVVITEAFMYRHHPQTIQVQELIESGALGELQLVSGSFSFKLTRKEDIRLIPEVGGGSLWDVGCYPLHYARTIIGKEPVEAFGWQISGTSGVDEVFAGQLRFAGQVFAQFDCGFRSPFRTHIEIVGEQGSLDIPAPFKPGQSEVITLTGADEVRKIKIKSGELYSGEIEDMADAILEARPPRISLADSRGNVAAILALLESAAKGQPVSITQ